MNFVKYSYSILLNICSFKGTNPCDLIKCGPGQECDIDQFGVASCQCPPSCEPKMQPVCGSNGRTFDNECELKRQSCLLRQELSVMHEGECGKDHYIHFPSGMLNF